MTPYVLTASVDAALAALYGWQAVRLAPRVPRRRVYILWVMAAAMTLCALDNLMGRSVHWLTVVASFSLVTVVAVAGVEIIVSAIRDRRAEREMMRQDAEMWAQMKEGWQQLFARLACPRCGARDLRVEGTALRNVTVRCAECRYIVEDVYMKIMEAPD